MTRPVPKIRTVTESPQVTPVPNSSRTSEQDLADRPVLFPLPPRGEQVEQAPSEHLAEALEHHAAVLAERQRERAELDAARQHGIAKRHAAKLRHLNRRNTR